MKYEEVRSVLGGRVSMQYMVSSNEEFAGEHRSFYLNGKLHWHYFERDGWDYGEKKSFTSDGVVYHHYLKDGKGNELATVTNHGEPSTHSEEQLIEIAKEHNLPLLSELPKTEVELTHWNIKYPDFPCLPIESE